MNDIEEIKQRLNVVDLIGQYVTLKKSGANYKAVCPFHHEKAPSLMVSPAKQIWKCFGCQRGGDIFGFIMEAEKLEFADALRLLAEKAGVTLKARSQAEHQSRERKNDLYRLNNYAARVFQAILLSKNGEAAYQYLLGRGLSEETIKTFQLGFAPKESNLASLLRAKGVEPRLLARVGSPERFFNRIIFPIRDVLGNVVGFTGRILGEGEPKYLNTPETALFNKSRILYNLDLARKTISESGEVILVEGQMDVIALWQAGFKNVVASSGTAVTENQLLILSKYASSIVLALDNDSAGQAATKKVIELMLKNDLSGRVVDFGQYKDPGEILEKSPNFWQEATEKAQEYSEWLVKTVIGDGKLIRQIEQKKRILKELMPYLALVRDPTRLDHLVMITASRLAVKPEIIYTTIEKTSRPSQDSRASRTAAPALSSEERYLALLVDQPVLFSEHRSKFEAILFKSEITERIAIAIKKLYTDTELIQNQVKFFSALNSSLDSLDGEKLSSWLFSLDKIWPSRDSTVVAELVKETEDQLLSQAYEQKKIELASEIHQAQAAGDHEKLKTLLKKLTRLTKENT